MRAVVLAMFITPLVGGTVLGQCGTAYRTRAYSSYSYTAPSYSYAAPTYAAPVVKKAVVKELAVVQYQAVIPYAYALLNVYPSYGAQYSPPAYPSYPPQGHGNGGPQQQQQTPPNGNGQAGELKQILEAVKGIDSNMRNLDARLRTLEERAAPKAPAAPKKEDDSKEGVKLELPDVRKVAQAKCAMCHQEGNESKGGKFVMLSRTGDLLPLTNERLLSMSEHVYAGSMPPVSAKTKDAGITPLTDAEAAAYMRWIAVQRKRNAAL